MMLELKDDRRGVLHFVIYDPGIIILEYNKRIPAGQVKILVGLYVTIQLILSFRLTKL